MNILHSTRLSEDRTMDIRSVNVQADLDLLWRWWNAPHVLGNWSMLFRLGEPRAGGVPYLKEDLAKYLAKVDSPPSELTPLILRINNCDVAYCEAYRVGSSPLAHHPKVNADDRGVHLMIGERSYTGQGFGTEVLKALTRWQLEKYPRANQVMGDPDCRNQRAVKAVLAIPGSVLIGDYPLGYKVATVIVLGSRDRMGLLC